MTGTILIKFETLLNTLIRLDPRAYDQLSRLNGKIIRIEVNDIDLSFLVSVTAGELKFIEAGETSADVTISGTAAALSGLLIRQSPSASLSSNHVEIRGDIHLAQEIQNILKQMDIDWEEYASRWIGDTAARKLGNLVRARRKWLRETRANVMADISEYLRFEIEMLPDRLLVDEFNNAVDELRDDTDRLQQRVDRLEKRLGRERE